MSSSAAAALSLRQQTFRRSSKRICCSAAAAEEEEVQASGQDALRKPPSQGRLSTPPRQTQDSLKSWSGLPSSQCTSQIIVAYLLHQKCNQTGPVVIPSAWLSSEVLYPSRFSSKKPFFFFSSPRLFSSPFRSSDGSFPAARS